MDDMFENYKNILAEKMKTVKHGSNVLHLDFVGKIDISDLDEIKSDLSKINFELSYYDKNGVIYNDLDEFKLISAIVINHPLLTTLIGGVFTNATWDVIKIVTMKLWHKLKTQKYTKGSISKKVERNISFGMKFIVDGNSSFEFELNGDLDDEIVLQSLDKILLFLKAEKESKSNIEPYNFFKYNYEIDKWFRINMLEQIIKKANKPKLQ